MNRRRSRRAANGARNHAHSPRGHANDARALQGARQSAHRGSGQLRLIGGDFRRRKLPIPESPGLRPTPDRVRETLFNWLAFDIAGRRVLDLYAGTGALGLEALSRGAAQALFVESTAHVAAALEANIAMLGAAGQVHRTDVERFLAGTPAAFDIVFLDPPFRQGLAQRTCQALESGGWLSPGAMIYVETEHELDWQAPGHWQLHRDIVAGDSHGRLFRRQPTAK
ncbi:16S rRNA (guanine(966)-N(2))-methyltransferase RsmD [Salinicola salarius]|uniref:16S rRNA (guanine(966)-N(2))-methyltransferase RsmD n=1 Tax=Salinicola salarius TaxID=430457 RepID=UPI0023E3B64E|nr:16S rRNA (guanine(966)-N(2))-methyltransferase RsmD [Salinicola salarius]MDF3920450.1 16S rRNA (guanine(966)-N(2))-methyltransferase RsmD [Salinicola salarius]